MGILNTIQYKNVFSQVGNRLIWRFDAETLWIEAWGTNSLRVRCTRQAQMDESPWALLEPEEGRYDFCLLYTSRCCCRCARICAPRENECSISAARNPPSR